MTVWKLIQELSNFSPTDEIELSVEREDEYYDYSSSTIVKEPYYDEDTHTVVIYANQEER